MKEIQFCIIRVWKINLSQTLLCSHHLKASIYVKCRLFTGERKSTLHFLARLRLSKDDRSASYLFTLETISSQAIYLHYLMQKTKEICTQTIADIGQNVRLGCQVWLLGLVVRLGFYVRLIAKDRSSQVKLGFSG